MWVLKISNSKNQYVLISPYPLPQSRSFVHLLPLLPESRTSERLCQMRDVSEDILCISKDIVSLKAKFTTALHKILHRGQ